MTTHEVLERVNSGEVVIVDNDWTYEYRKNELGKWDWEQIWFGDNWKLFETLEVYHPEVTMENDERAGVMWVYRRTAGNN